MPRRARLFVPGCRHYIMSRGLDGMDIFRDDDYRRTFVELLSKNSIAADMRCYAWVFTHCESIGR